MCRSFDQRLLQTVGLCRLETPSGDESISGPIAADFAHHRFATREAALDDNNRARRATDATHGPRAKGRERNSDERASRKPYTKGGWRRETDRHYSEPVELIDALTLARTAHGRSDD